MRLAFRLKLGRAISIGDQVGFHYSAQLVNTQWEGGGGGVIGRTLSSEQLLYSKSGIWFGALRNWKYILECLSGWLIWIVNGKKEAYPLGYCETSVRSDVGHLQSHTHSVLCPGAG